jgi:hypothetical protein
MYTSNWAVFGCLRLHKYTWYASGCETEYVWGTCVDLIPAYFYDWRSLAEVESIKAVKCRHRVYGPEFGVFFGSLCLHKYTWYASGCGTEYVWGTCVDLIPAYFYDWRSLAEVESIKAVKCRVLLYTRQFEWFSGAYVYTNTHGMLVVVRQNMCGVPVWTWFRHISMIEGRWRKLRA